jgi:ATP-binding cassette subfamily B protein
MRTVLSYLKDYRITAITAFLLMLIELSVELILPLLLAKIIDEGILKGQITTVLYWGGIMAGITLFAFITAIFNSFFSAHVSQSYGYDIRKALYGRIQNFTFSNLNKYSTSSLITRLTNDVTQLQNTIFMGLRIMPRAPLIVIGSMIMAFTVNIKLAIILVIIVPILFIFLLFILKKGRKHFKLVQEKLDTVNNVMQENLTAMRLIKAFLRHTYESTRFQQASTNLMETTSRSLRLMETTMPVLLLVMNISIVGLLWLGRTELSQGNILVGEAVAVLNYALRITSTFSVFSFIIMGFSRFRASADRVAQILDDNLDLENTREELHCETVSLKGKVEFQHLTFQYPNTDKNVLEDISFTVNAGDTVAVLGATGSGKTTLFQMIPRLYEAKIGKILINRKEIADYPLKGLRRRIGYVAQESLLFTGTIKENILWGKQDASMDEVITASRNAQIHNMIMSLPNQYETKLGQKGVNLSGGQKQRLSIARALIRKPDVLLLDDSTSALDLETESHLLRAIREYTCTTFIITQKITTAMEADLVLLLDEGKLIGKGKHVDLMEKTPLYQQIYQSQMNEVSDCYVKGIK